MIRPFLLLAALLHLVAGEVDPASIPASAYVTVSADGHLETGGERVRFWGVIGNFPYGQASAERSQAANRALVQRFLDLGFNLSRFRHVLADPEDQAYQPGDNSRADQIDHFIATWKAAGGRLWLRNLDTASVGPGDAGVIDEPASAEAWAEAVRSWAGKGKKGGGTVPLHNSLARYWDPRLEAIGHRHLRAVLDHRSQHTGLRWGDDPVFAIMELSNEEWWVRNMLGGRWRKLPEFFQRSLLARWNGWLRERYRDQTGLVAAWGRLLPEEDLAAGSVRFAPLAEGSKAPWALNDANREAQAAAQAGGGSELAIADAPAQRCADLIRFLLDTQLAFKRREQALLKGLGRAARLAPLAFDTGIGWQIQAAWLHQQAEAVAHDAYVDGCYPPGRPEPAGLDPLQRLQWALERDRKAANAGPWVNWLLKPPGLSQGVPWLEHNRVEGLPFLCYETQIQQPAKYRADFPLRVGALAAIQDWDAVCWHFWGPADPLAERPYDRAMDITVGDHPQGYHFTFDEVQAATMRAAGTAFVRRAFAPAPRPTTFIYGRRSLHDPASMTYPGSYGLRGLDMLPTTWQHGVRLRIDPSREDDAVEGPVLPFADYATHNPYTPTAEITHDWKAGFLRLQAPAALAWTGSFARSGGKVAFPDGTELEGVRLDNPPGIADPVAEDEQYLAFTCTADDGLPLARSQRVSISLVSTSFNSGFVLGGEGVKRVAGKAPVQVVRVAGSVRAPWLAGRRYSLRDWHMQELATGRVGADGVLRLPAGQPVWVAEIAP